MTDDPSPPTRTRWQFRLHTLFLLVAAIAVWIAFFLNRQRNAQLEARIASMVPLAHELLVADPRAIAVVKLEEYWYGENRWDFYVPEGSFELGLATRGIDREGIPPDAKLRDVPSEIRGTGGSHRLALEERQVGSTRRIIVRCDGAEWLTAEEPESWYSGSSSSTGDSLDVSKPYPPEQPVVILRRRFQRRDARGKSSDPGGPAEGVMIWIQPKGRRAGD